jgi:hypothetical protein
MTLSLLQVPLLPHNLFSTLSGVMRLALFHWGNVGKNCQRRSRPFAVLTYSMYAPRVIRAAALLGGPPPSRGHAFLNIPIAADVD